MLQPNSTSKTTTALSHALAFGLTLIIGLVIVSVALQLVHVPPVAGFERHYPRPRSAAAYDAALRNGCSVVNPTVSLSDQVLRCPFWAEAPQQTQLPSTPVILSPLPTCVGGPPSATGPCS